MDAENVVTSELPLTTFLMEEPFNDELLIALRSSHLYSSSLILASVEILALQNFRPQGPYPVYYYVLVTRAAISILI